jgi:hypothetical protein
MDLSGHIASAAQFARSGMHSFNDRMFLGTTHNLFYPPLEDLLINFFKLISFQNYIVSFQIYIMLLLYSYMAILFFIGKKFQNKIAYLFYHISILALFTIEKGGGLYLQGMTFDDLFIIGLTNQFLSGLGLFWISKEIISPSKNSDRNIIVAGVFSILSHIVVGAVSFGLAFFFLILRKNKESKIKPFILILGICSFYIIPFLYYKSYITNSNILVDQPWIPFWLACTAFLFSLKSIETRVFLILSCLLFSTVTVFPSVGFLSNLLPSFHYYRFTVVAYYLFILGLAHILNTKQTYRVGHFVLPILGIIFIGHIFFRFDTRKDYFKIPNVTQQEINLDEADSKNSSFGRTLLFSSDRTAGTSIESLLTINSGTSRFAKGLFWESSYTNLVESSFLATLLTPPVVLDYFYYYGYLCEIRRCLMDEHFRLYNIKEFISNFDQLDYINYHDRECYRHMMGHGSDRYSFAKKQTFNYDSKYYHLYKLENKESIASSPLESVELISPEQIKLADNHLLKTAENIVVERFNSCLRPTKEIKNFSVFLQGRDENKFNELKANYKTTGFSSVHERFIKLQKISNSEYTFNLPNFFSWYTLKLSPQPGMVILNHEGVEMPILRGVPYTIGVGRGEMRVIFKRTLVMWLGYCISIFSIAFFIRTFFLNREKT